MTLDKDQLPILKGIIKASYSPVLKRAIVNLFLLGLEQVRLDNFPGKTQEFFNVLHSDKGHKACKEIIKDIYNTRENMIVELMKQYGIDKDQSEFNIYLDELTLHFSKHISQVEQLVFNNRFQELVQLSKVTEQ